MEKNRWLLLIILFFQGCFYNFHVIKQDVFEDKKIKVNRLYNKNYIKLKNFNVNLYKRIGDDSPNRERRRYRRFNLLLSTEIIYEIRGKYKEFDDFYVLIDKILIIKTFKNKKILYNTGQKTGLLGKRLVTKVGRRYRDIQIIPIFKKIKKEKGMSHAKQFRIGNKFKVRHYRKGLNYYLVRYCSQLDKKSHFSKNPDSEERYSRDFGLGLYEYMINLNY